MMVTHLTDEIDRLAREHCLSKAAKRAIQTSILPPDLRLKLAKDLVSNSKTGRGELILYFVLVTGLAIASILLTWVGFDYGGMNSAGKAMFVFSLVLLMAAVAYTFFARYYHGRDSYRRSQLIDELTGKLIVLP